MTVEQAIYNLLRADAAVTAVCPQARIKVPGDWQDIDLPYIIHFPVSLTPTRTHRGLEPLREWDYQVSVHAATFSEGRALVDLIITALDGWHSGIHCSLAGGVFYVGGTRDGLESEEFAIDFRVTEALTTSPL